MATKAQKREAGRIKHQRFIADIKRTGLEAQRRDREHRKQKHLSDTEVEHKKSHGWKKLVKDCPHCDEMIAKSKARNTKKEK